MLKKSKENVIASCNYCTQSYLWSRGMRIKGNKKIYIYIFLIFLEVFEMKSVGILILTTYWGMFGYEDIHRRAMIERTLTETLTSCKDRFCMWREWMRCVAWGIWERLKRWTASEGVSPKLGYLYEVGRRQLLVMFEWGCTSLFLVWRKSNETGGRKVWLKRNCEKSNKLT